MGPKQSWQGRAILELRGHELKRICVLFRAMPKVVCSRVVIGDWPFCEPTRRWREMRIVWLRFKKARASCL